MPFVERSRRAPRRRPHAGVMLFKVVCIYMAISLGSAAIVVLRSPAVPASSDVGAELTAVRQ
jgi:hypothetical protein